MIITLNDRIKQDLQNLLTAHQIDAAINLSKELFGEAVSNENAISTKGIPGYYTGDREAKTVMLMLNPGVSAKKNDEAYKAERIKYGIDSSSLDAFTSTYHIRCQTGVENDLDEKGKIRKDNFDVKQAAFLKDWTDCGVDIDEDFPSKAKDNDELLRKVRVDVLEQKLQLELVPYASQKFRSLGRQKLCCLFPYLETAFDEIFRVKNRKYVIFCSKFFVRLLKAYSKKQNKDFQVTLLKKKSKSGILNNGNVYCTPVKIVYQGKELTAIIAHTFTSYALPNAYDKMQKYGEFCYTCWRGKV